LWGLLRPCPFAGYVSPRCTATHFVSSEIPVVYLVVVEIRDAGFSTASRTV